MFGIPLSLRERAGEGSVQTPHWLPVDLLCIIEIMTTAKKALAILGSTGSIGTQTLDVVRTFPDRFDVVGLSCNRSLELLSDQISEFKP